MSSILVQSVPTLQTVRLPTRGATTTASVRVTTVPLSGLATDLVFLVSILTAPRRYFCVDSLLPVFGVRVSVTFHLFLLHIIFSSVWVAELPPFLERATYSVDHMLSLYFDYLLF